MTLNTVTVTRIWEETSDIRGFALRPNSGTIHFAPVHMSACICRAE